MKALLRNALPFFPATLAAYIVGAALATQVTLNGVAAHGIRVSLDDRLYATGYDLLGLARTYLPLVAIAFLIALPTAAGLARWLPQLRLVLYGLAGAAALVVLHLVARKVLGVTALAATREFSGVLFQAVAGWFGGYVYFVATGWAHRPGPSPDAPRRA